MPLLLSLIAAGAMVAVAGASAAAQTSTLGAQPASPPKSLCAECHLVNATARSRAHLIDWQRSMHAASGVGCEACHGGDPGTVDPMRAHLSIKGDEDPGSPVSRAHLPDTCGKCHTRVAEQFKKSVHFVRLQSAAGLGAPTCSTCHGAAGAKLPKAEEVRVQCAQCHSVGKQSGHPEYPPAALVIMVQYEAARLMLDATADFIPIISTASIRASLGLDEARATTALHTTAEAIHTMDYDAIDQTLTVAFDRVVALIRRAMTTVPPSRR